MVLMGPPSTPRRPITFYDADTYAIHFPHNDALVITMLIGNCRMSKISVDCESNINILYKGTLDKMEDTLQIA